MEINDVYNACKETIAEVENINHDEAIIAKAAFNMMLKKIGSIKKEKGTGMMRSIADHVNRMGQAAKELE